MNWNMKILWQLLFLEKTLLFLEENCVKSPCLDDCELDDYSNGKTLYGTLTI